MQAWEILYAVILYQIYKKYNSIWYYKLLNKFHCYIQRLFYKRFIKLGKWKTFDVLLSLIYYIFTSNFLIKRDYYHE